LLLPRQLRFALLMKPAHFDPNNHAPEVAPYDSWGDLDGDKTEAPAPYLPPRRTVTEKPAATLVGGELGLRIDSVISRSEPHETSARLEVQEIGGRSIKRLDQAEPRPEKVIYQGGFKAKPEPDPEAEDKTGEGQDWGEQKRISTKHLAILAGSVLAFIIVGMTLLPFIDSRNAPKGESSAPKYAVVDEEILPGMEEMDFFYAPQRQQEATDLFRAYLQAKSVEEVIPLIQQGETLRSTLVQHWLPQQVPASWTPDSNTLWSVPETSDRAHGLLEGNFPDQSPFTAFFTQTGSHILLDWKATVAFGSASFDELNQGLGDASEIRGTLSSVPYYDPALSENDYVSYRLTAAKGNASIWCYARRGDAAELALASLFRQGEIVQEAQSTLQVTLHLVRGTDATQPNQWLIQELRQVGWLTPLPQNP
jgi:hypothetical protein